MKSSNLDNTSFYRFPFSQKIKYKTRKCEEKHEMLIPKKLYFLQAENASRYILFIHFYSSSDDEGNIFIEIYFVESFRFDCS